VQKPVYGIDKKTPLSLLEARNAVRIAKSAGADEYASDALKNAEQSLSQAEDYYAGKKGTKSIDTVARAAVQSAETARVAALKAEDQARLDRERQENAQRAADAQAQSAQAQADAQRAQQQADLAQQQAQLEAQQRQAAAQQAAQAQSDANMARQQAETAQQQAQQAQQQVAQTRAQLLGQLNQVLQTRDTARGLIVSMPDVLFETGKADLSMNARERLAKVAGILVAYPDIRVEIDGYTDSTGTVDLNQRLSENRAESVREYLAHQGVPASALSARGFGQDNPVASNDTVSGRQENRRVELVVSGQSIGMLTQP
jgi:outer membrane protein OmpA-like peptidoglycan-associated protein